MHSSVNNYDTSTSILSIKEIVGIIVIFSLVLYLVFPKDNIDEILEGKMKNTNLSINYLESMLLYYPDNVKLKRILIENYDHAGERQKALALIKGLIVEVEDEKILGELYKADYLINKDIYFHTEDKSLLPKIKDKLYDYFGYAYNKSGELDYMFFLGESTQMDFPDLKYVALEGLMEESPELVDYSLEKEAFILALALDKKEDAYKYLLKILEYDELERELKIYAIRPLLEHEEYEKARGITTWLFLNSKDEKEINTYFNMALYTINEDVNSTREFLSLYRNSREVKSSDVQTILNCLLQIGDSQGASSFAMSLFKSNPKAFDEVATQTAVKSLVYNEQLASALELSHYAYSEFNSTKWLDKSIQFSIWLGKMDKAIELNIIGYREQGDKRYEKYLLESTTLDSAYEILGDIYKNKLESGDHSMVEKVVEYYSYIGAVADAEKYFLRLFKKDKHKSIHRAVIEFSYNNSHFEQGLKLYDSYKKRYGIDKTLQQESITKLLALKKFKRAYSFSQELESIEKYDKNLQALRSKLELHDEFRLHTKLNNLAWIHRDFKYIYNIMWKHERRGTLEATNYEKLIYLEKAFKKRGKLAYLYKKAWQETNRSIYIYILLSFYMKHEEFDKFASLSKKHEKLLEKDINYNILLANYYIKVSNIKKAKKSFLKAIKLDAQNISTHESYLWFLINNRLNDALSKEISFLRKNPKLQQKIGAVCVIGATVLKKYKLALKWSKSTENSLSYIDKTILSLYIGNRADAYSFAFEGLEKSYSSPDLYRIYSDMINQEYPKREALSRYKHLSPNLTTIENRLSYRWQFYKGFESKFSFTQYKYQIENSKNIKDNTLSIALNNSNEKFSWDFDLAKHHTDSDFISSKLNLLYRLSDISFGIESKYQNKTKQTPKLQSQGLENSIELKLRKSLTQRVQLLFSYKESSYKMQNMIDIGDSSQIQMSADYLLRAGYPDMRFNTYLTHNEYENIDNYKMLPDDFIEIGTQFTIGTSSKNRIGKSWKPFGTIGIAINDNKKVGTSLSIGLSGALKGEDSLNILFDYSKGMDMISYPSYGVHLDYRF